MSANATAKPNSTMCAKEDCLEVDCATTVDLLPRKEGEEITS